MNLPNTVSAGEIQRSYRKIFDLVKETQEPVIVMTNSKPDVAIVPVNQIASLSVKSVEKGTKQTSSLKKLYGLWTKRKEWRGKTTATIIREMRRKRLKRIYGKS